MSKYEFEADGSKTDFILAEADGLTGKTLASFIGKYGGGVDLILTNNIYGKKYAIRLMMDRNQIRNFLAEGVREMSRVQQFARDTVSQPSNVIPLRPR